MDGIMIVLAEAAALVALVLATYTVLETLAWTSYHRQGGRKGLMAWMKDQF